MEGCATNEGLPRESHNGAIPAEGQPVNIVVGQIAYPDKWQPVRAESGDCPDLTGRYRFLGDLGGEPTLDGSIELATFGYGRISSDPLRRPDYVNIAMDIPKRMRVTYLRADQNVYFRYMVEGLDYDCKAGTLQLIMPNGRGPRYLRTRDGALVAYLRYFDGTPVGFILTVRAGSAWARWELVEADTVTP